MRGIELGTIPERELMARAAGRAGQLISCSTGGTQSAHRGQRWTGSIVPSLKGSEQRDGARECSQLELTSRPSLMSPLCPLWLVPLGLVASGKAVRRICLHNRHHLHVVARLVRAHG